MSRMFMGQGRQPGDYSQDYPQAFQEYNTQYKGQKEWVGWRWWDTQTFTSTTTTELARYFNVRASTDLSNMEVAFQLAAPKAFFWRSTRVFFKRRPRTTSQAATANNQTGLIDDVQQLIQTGVVEITIGNKIYAQDALWLLTAGAGPAGFMVDAGATAANLVSDYAQNGIADPRAVDTKSKPLFIAPQINFSARIFWPATLTLTANTDICLCLDGDLVRPVQ